MDGLDELSVRLIRLLEEDARQSTDLIAKKLQVSPITVSRRIRKLIRENIMRIVAVTNTKKVGLPLAVIMRLDVEFDKLSAVMNTIAERPEAAWVFSTSGRHDIVALFYFRDDEELSSFTDAILPKVKGIRSIDTSIRLRSINSMYAQQVLSQHKRSEQPHSNIEAEN